MRRRDVLLSGLLTALPRLSRAATAPSVAPELLSAVKLAHYIRRGDIDLLDHVRAVIERAERWRALNAFIAFDPDKLLADARRLQHSLGRGQGGPLCGIPIPIKDSVNTADYATSAGTAALRRFRPVADAPAVARLRAAGALVMGKTNLHELSYGWTSNNGAFGAVHNPYRFDCIPGGSSGGTAAAVAAGLAPFGLAEDTEGSIRVPAALCGLAGFRPTTGRYATEGAAPISPLFDQIGPVARHAEDLLLFDQLLGPDPSPIKSRRLTGVRIAIAHDPMWQDLHPEVEKAAKTALRRLEANGAVLVEADFPGLFDRVAAICEPIQNHDVRIALESYLKRYGAPVDFAAVVSAASSDIRNTFEHDVLPGSPGFISDERYRAMIETELPRLRNDYREFFARTQTTAIVFPTTRVTAPTIGEEDTVDIGGRTIDLTRALAGNIAPGSTAGLPSLVLPIGLDSRGLPISLEFDGPAGSDRALLSLAVSLEETLGRLPPPEQPT